MARLSQINLQVNPPLPQGVTAGISQSPLQLAQWGMNLLVEISTASAFLTPPNANVRSTTTVMGHIDTGASMTSLDQNLAHHLGLVSVGQGRNATANGFSVVSHYAVDIAFLNSALSSIQNLLVSSCQLPHFRLQQALQNPIQPVNFGILIGHDILARWNLTWHGPTSTVFISD